MKRQRGAQAAASLCSMLLLLLCPTVAAQTVPDASSTTYSVDQVFFGSGTQDSCSTTFCARQTVGETAVGNAAGTAFQAMVGSNVKREPYIAFSTSSGTTDLGILSTAATATANATFAVKTYLANGYIVALASDPPTATGAGAHIFAGMTTAAFPAAPGSTEQFGVNVVANTTGCGAPINFGADPVQVPGGTFSYGTAATGYDTCGKFKYVKGDTVATSPKSSGETDYTMSFIYNISNVTPNGNYVFNGDLVAVSTY